MIPIQSREKTIRLWFDMWLQKQDLGIADIFSYDAIYIESWGPKYKGSKLIKHWFTEWNNRGNVLVWDVKQFFHKEDQTLVEWYFKNTMVDGKIEEFDGISLIQWTQDEKICILKEFGCNINNYNPYQNSLTPQFKDQNAIWF